MQLSNITLQSLAYESHPPHFKQAMSYQLLGKNMLGIEILAKQN